MKYSYILRASSGGIVLPPQVRDQLTLEENSTLYGVTAPDTDEPRSYVLSTIPSQYWQTAFRLQIYIASDPGSLGKVAAYLSEKNINILAAWSAATSPTGEGCLTATVQIPPNILGRASDDGTKSNVGVLNEKQIREIEATILGSLLEVEALSRSRLFKGEDSLSLVRLTKLRVLAKLGSLYDRDDKFRIELKNSTLNLNSAIDASGKNLDLLEDDKEYRFGGQIIITPDTEERYFKMALLPSWTYKKISLNLRVKSGEDEFSGYYDRAISALAEKRINILSSQNILMTKTEEVHNGGYEFVEEARFSFLVNVTQSGLVGLKNGEGLRALMKDRLVTFGESCQAEVDVSEWRMDDLRELSLPVFIATNAKPSIDDEWKKMALDVITKLKERGLRPVNVDISVGSSLASEVESLIRQCPLVVSLFLPEDGLLMASEAGSERSYRYAPSDYTMYEEALARSLRIPLLRLRHKEVFKPRYLGDPIEYEFNSNNKDKVLRAFADALDYKLNSEDFHSACRRCRKLRQKNGVGLMHIFRDTEGWLRGEGR